MTPEEEKVRKELKKRLGQGIIIPAGHGIIISTCDVEEYKQSKADKGFIWQMPICLHIRATGAGMYDESISKYMSLEEAKVLLLMLGATIASIEEGKVDE